MSDTGDQTNENLIWCAKTGDLATLKTLLNKNPKKIEELLNGRLLSHYAADAGQVDVLKELVHNGAKVNTKDRYGITPLLAAIYEDHVDCVKYLLEQRADVNGKSPDDLSYEQCCNNDEIRALILKHKQSTK